MLESGDIVQIIDEKHHWHACLLIVKEVKSWEVQGYITLPQDNKGNKGNAYIRIKNEQNSHINF